MTTNYKGLELTAKHNTLSVLIDDFKQGGGKATLLSIYVFLKENRDDRELFLKFLNLIPDYILTRVCKLSAEVGDGEFETFITHHKLLADYQPQTIERDGYWHIGMDF